MTINQLLLRFSLSLALSLAASAQPWSGIIDSARAIDWTQAGVQGGIPSKTWTQCGATIQPYGTMTSFASPSTINNAIAACGTNQYVLLGPGSFYLSGGIVFSGKNSVVLRGSNAHYTHLYFNATTVCNSLYSVICLSDGSNFFYNSMTAQPGGSQAASLTGSYAHGATTLTATNIGSSGIVNGQMIFFDQAMNHVYLSSLSENGTTVTATATGPLPSNYFNGATVQVSGVGVSGYNTTTGTLSNVNQAAGTFQYSVATSGLPTSDNTTLVKLSSATSSGKTVTMTAAGPLPNTFANGNLIVVSGVSVSGYNSTGQWPTYSFPISNVNQAAGTFQYTTPGSNLGPATGGTAVLSQGVSVADSGQLIVCAATDLCGWRGFPTPDTTGIGRNISNTGRRETFQATKVIAGCAVKCTGAGPFTLTISPGIYVAADAANAPGIWWPSPGLSNAGVENLTVDQTYVTSGTHFSAIGISECQGCWVTGIESMYGYRNHIWVYNSRQVTLRNNYFYAVKSGGGPQSYGVEFGLASDNVVENNIFQQISAPFMAGATESAVFAYNYALNEPVGSMTSMSAQAWMTHDVNQYSLFEGNVGTSARADSTFSNGDLCTMFRNRWTGADYADGAQKSQYTYPIGLEFWNRFYNAVGNVLGTPGYHTTYETSPNVCSTGCTNAETSASIYTLGFSGGLTGGSCENVGFCPADSVVAASLFRWGNYDVVNSAAQWNPSEVPYSASYYPNAVPPSRVLPASLYLSGAPSWWLFPSGTAAPFPAIGPDVTGGNGPGGHSYLIPAQNCYMNVMAGPANGTGGPLSFNPTFCYGQ